MTIKWQLHHMHIPAEFLDEVLSTSADPLGELYDINSLQNDIVCPHWVRA